MKSIHHKACSILFTVSLLLVPAITMSAGAPRITEPEDVGPVDAISIAVGLYLRLPARDL